jgi:hypothetical protein
MKLPEEQPNRLKVGRAPGLICRDLLRHGGLGIAAGTCRTNPGLRRHAHQLRLEPVRTPQTRPAVPGARKGQGNADASA